MDSNTRKIDVKTYRGFEEIIGPLPNRSIDTSIEFLETEERDGIVCQRILYGADNPGDVAALLLYDRTRDSHRPCLALHQTTRPPTIGKDEPAGRGGDSHLHYGAELAARGFMVLCPDYPGFGEGGPSPETILNDLEYESVSMKGVVNHIAGIDVLERLAGSPLSDVVAIGHSLGGSNSIFLSFFDNRVGAVVSSCGFSDFRSYAKNSPTGDMRGWARMDKYMPNIATRFKLDVDHLPVDFGDILKSLAPCPLFFNIAKRDDIFPYEGALRALSEATERYAELSVRDRIEVHTPDLGHEFPAQIRTAAYAFAEKHTRCISFKF